MVGSEPKMEWPNVSRRMHLPPAFGHSYLLITREVTRDSITALANCGLIRATPKELASASFVTPQLHYFLRMPHRRTVYIAIVGILIVVILGILLIGRKKEE